MSEMDELPSLLLVDDDETFTHVLARAMTRRGFAVSVAHDATQAIAMAAENPPEYAVLDLKMPGDSGLTLIRHLKALDEETRIVVLTGYASIATAVEAVKLGATYYLAKPADADEIMQALERKEADEYIPLAANPLSVDRMEWEHIQRVLKEHDGNISATARSLNMHRRTLQRKLNKHPTRQ